MKPNTPETFWARVRIGGGDECWEWTGFCAKGSRGGGAYGRVTFLGRRDRSHRVAYFLTHPDWDRQGFILHTCDNPPCCNPAHLMLGDHDTNMAQKAARNRCNPPIGARQGRSKLTEADVLAIRASPLTQTALAEQYGVRQTNIQAILAGKTWRHVGGPPAKSWRKLTPDQVRAIRGDPRRYRIIAADYGVGYYVIAKIKCGKSWQHC